MKRELKLITILLFFGAASVVEAAMVARVKVQSEHDIILLHQMGVKIEDVNVRARVDRAGLRRYSIRWNSENGFVTIVGEEEQLQRVKDAGLTILSTSPIAEGALVPPSPTLLDTIPYQFGWPRSIFNGLSLYENSPTVADFDLNGQLDVSVTNAWGSYSPANPPYVIAWRRNGAYLQGFPVPLDSGLLQSSADAGIAAAADVYGDSKLELVLGDENGFLYAFTSGGAPLPGFPRHYGYFVGVFTPALADCDNDGKADIAVITHDWDSPYGNANLHLLKVTPSGPVEFPGFPINLERGAENSPAIGDLDGDGTMEIVVGTGGTSSGPSAKIIAFTTTGQVATGFPFVVGMNSVGNSPTLYDINNDGTLEILIRMKPDNNVNGIYAIDFRGQIVPGFPFPITYGNPSACVAVGDMDGDNIPELAYGGVEAVDSGKVWVYNLSGALLPGFPARVYRTWVDGSVAIADVDGDGKGDVVCGTNGVSSRPGLIRAFNYLGQELPGFPISPGNPLLTSFETHPTLVDIDGDGDTEIFGGRLDKFVYAWDTPGVFDSVKAWRTFKGNAARTGGQLRSPISLAVGDANGVAREFVLEQNYPNPFNPSTRIRFSVGGSRLEESGSAFMVQGSGAVTMKVYDVLGKEVATLVNQDMKPGSYTVTWNATGKASGVYYYQLRTTDFVQTKKMLLLR